MHTKRISILLSTLCILTSCTHRYKIDPIFKATYEKILRQDDTLICQFQSCTDCLDLYILKGAITVPQELSRPHCNDGTRDIKVCGNFPMDLIDITSFNFRSDIKFRITGKVVSIDKDNAIGEVPLFYVSTWKKL